MTTPLSLQLIGNTPANVAEVEATTRALRATLRPADYKTQGIYCCSAKSGTMAAALATASRIWSFRWTDASKVCLVRRVVCSASNTLAFTAGILQLNLFNARSFTTSDSAGGTEFGPNGSGDFTKLRTSMASSLLGSFYMASTGAISAGVMGLDGDPVASLICGAPATAGTTLIKPTPFFDQRPGEYPWVLRQNEGLILQSGGIAIAATGTWVFTMQVYWDEVLSYP